MIPARLSLVTIGAYDFSLLREFYGKLGWKEAISTDGFVAYGTGGALLSLYPIDDLMSDSNAATPVDRGSFRGITCAINVGSPEEVDAAMDAAREAGATILKPPVDAEWGGRSGYFSDPENNVWEIAWMPGSSFDENGGLITP